jgi:hypothetical protein
MKEKPYKIKWKQVGFGGCRFTVSSSGHIIYDGKFLKQFGNPYSMVRAQHTNHLVHRIVAKAFCKKYSETLVVNHLLGNKKQNVAKLLECCTSSENIKHAHRIGLIDYSKRKKKLCH